MLTVSTKSYLYIYKNTGTGSTPVCAYTHSHWSALHRRVCLWSSTNSGRRPFLASQWHLSVCPNHSPAPHTLSTSSLYSTRCLEWQVNAAACAQPLFVYSPQCLCVVFTFSSWICHSCVVCVTRFTGMLFCAVRFSLYRPACESQRRVPF